MIMKKKIEDLLLKSTVKNNVELKNYSYTKTGGMADKLILVKTADELIKILNFAKETNEQVTILGNGSNVLISDKGIRGITIVTQEMKKIELLENNLVSCEAGVTLKELTDFLIEKELSGLEFACGIPGSIGGAIFMNAGAYGGEVKDVVATIETVTLSGEKKVYSNKDMKFAYRYSVVQETKDIITKVYFQLKEGVKTEILEKVTQLNKLRSDKQPLEYPSCGSVFKRPEGYFAGKLIQDAGLQGLTVGGAQVSKKHAGFMVNINNATCDDYKELIKQVQEKVLADSGVKLEPEVKIIGEE
ncbi:MULTISPECIES: UDP-N-acetylmuramate dehydrogenase [unclassified Gemella]|uniref:UDP-N-acetylmuramate dehydrogenase n=1 Tax=unclassified Gemella TaxID=2624949 RepID=UPI0015D087F8|nr:MULTISPECIES: UDP-N-acetylmuramate dehydrogenase [unclassified Gemella]MBF0710714.1 UDP-N-acetylmuramate dehydrogenase [Gemella sp. GL1.1]NYS28058.1 UDP-N-acetylmuramate dehydrogenase [Gemella sp. GL1]